MEAVGIGTAARRQLEDLLCGLLLTMPEVRARLQTYTLPFSQPALQTSPRMHGDRHPTPSISRRKHGDWCPWWSDDTVSHRATLPHPCRTTILTDFVTSSENQAKKTRSYEVDMVSRVMCGPPILPLAPDRRADRMARHSTVSSVPGRFDWSSSPPSSFFELQEPRFSLRIDQDVSQSQPPIAYWTSVERHRGGTSAVSPPWCSGTPRARASSRASGSRVKERRQALLGPGDRFMLGAKGSGGTTTPPSLGTSRPRA